MSDLLRLAAQLRKLPDAQLIAALQQRQVTTGNLRDFFDLGEQLLGSRALQATIASLSLSKLDALCAIARVDRIGGPTAPSNPRDTAELEHLFLIYRETESADWSAYGAVADTLRQLIDAKRKPKQKPSLVVLSEARASEFSLTAEQTTAALSQDEIDRDCGIAIFETMQALTEMVFYLEQHFVREVGRGNVGLPDLKRLAGRLNKTVDYAREIFELARLAQVASLVEQRWQLGASAHMWIDATPIERWTHLAQAWRAAIGDSAASDLVSALAADSEKSLDALLTQLYPLADSSIAAGIKRTVDRGNLIGITDNGLLSSWAIDVLGARFGDCLAKIESRMPTPVDRLIVQADLSLVAPGPLTTATEIRIREFADCEHIGFASTYRINTLSITLGMEGGLKAADIRELLVGLSGKDLPQPVEYLLRESEERFGRLVVHTSSMPEHSVATSSDPILLKSILNDPAMKPFGLVENSAGDLACKFDSEVLYFGLREAGFAAIRAEREFAYGSAAPQGFALEFAQGEPLDLEASIGADLARMREQDAKAGSAPDSDDVTRQIQLAIKNKARLNITVTTDAGVAHQFLLEPTGIANGRLRAKDRKADIERTLPLASITQVTLA
ncbi:MAG: helicase-associated domain-containing protein [Actinomycetales bacterium]|nr:helicase-associated domain-containing protein [Actinomycetales bacterium]